MRVLGSQISYKDILLFKRVRDTVADDWACLLVLSVSDDNEHVAELPRTQLYVTRNSLLKASATSMSSANLVLNSNIVFLGAQKIIL